MAYRLVRSEKAESCCRSRLLGSWWLSMRAGSRPWDKAGGRSSRPLEKGGPGLPKYFFRAFGHQFGLKIKGGPSPGSATAMATVLNMFFFNTGVPHCTALGLILFSIVINDIKAINTNRNLLVKFGGDITVSLPIEANVGLDESETKILSFIEWSEN